MQCVGSARPTLISSASKLCRYSTETPTPGKRQLVKEWGGITIPSRQEIQEKARKKAESQKPYETDISYLKNAPQKSLASRLARAEPKPQPKTPSLSPEAIEAITQRRREARLAREAEEAKALIRDFSSSPALTKAINAALDTPASLARSLPSRDLIPDVKKRLTPVAKPKEETPHRGREEEQATTSQVLERPANVDGEVKLFQSSDLREKVATTLLDAEEQPKDGKIPIKETLPPSQRELQAASVAKRRDERLRRKETNFSREISEPNGASLGLNHREALAASIAKRREERLRRAREEAENPQLNRRDKFSSNKDGQRAKPRRPNHRKTSESAQDLELSIVPDEDRTVLPEFSGPEPISQTLSEIFNINPPIAHTFSPKSGNYSKYVNSSMKFSTPPNELSPVNVAKLTLSHRAGISLPKRKQAVDIITQAFQPRSPRTAARA